jgi:hypothetical protein
VTVTRGVSGRDHLLWLHYRANVYSIMGDTPKTAGKSAKTVTPSDSRHIPAIPVTKIVLGAVVAMTVTDSGNLLSMVALIMNGIWGGGSSLVSALAGSLGGRSLLRTP